MRSHANTESVCIAAFGFFWLISSFHDLEIVANKRGFVTVGGS